MKLTISQEPNTLQEVLDDHRLEDVQLFTRTSADAPMLRTLTYLELSTRTRDANGSLVANNLRRDHGQGFALGRVDLAGHDAATRLVLRQAELTQSTAGARTKVPNIVCDLHERAGDSVECAVSLDERIVRRERLKLVRCSLELETGELGDLGSDLHVETLLGV